jgi:hypothetical protein
MKNEAPLSCGVCVCVCVCIWWFRCRHWLLLSESVFISNISVCSICDLWLIGPSCVCDWLENEPILVWDCQLNFGMYMLCSKLNKFLQTKLRTTKPNTERTNGQNLQRNRNEKTKQNTVHSAHTPKQNVHILLLYNFSFRAAACSSHTCCTRARALFDICKQPWSERRSNLWQWSITASTH